MRSSLPTPITAARAASNPSIPSIDALARKLIADFPDIPWPAPRSLAAKIGDLDRGVAVWWKKRGDEANALATVLQLDFSELGLQAEAGARLFPFKMFPELPPLDLTRDTLCELGTVVASQHATASLAGSVDLAWWHGAQSAGLQRHPGEGIAWIAFEQGTGLSLFWENLCERTPRRHERVRKLSLAASLLRDSGALVLRVDQPCDDADLRTLGNAAPGLAILIVAGFPAPQKREGSEASCYAWQFLSGGADPYVAALSNPDAMYRSIASHEWRLHDDWPARMLAWVETRLTNANADTLFSAQGVQRWLDHFSPWSAFKLLPADLLAICRFCHATRESELPRAIDQNAGRTMLARVLHVPASLASSFRQRVHARLLDLSLPWTGSLDEAAWARLAPGSGAPLEDAEFLAIADAKSAAERRRLARAAAQRQQISVLALVETELLVDDGAGNFRGQPAALIDLLARDYLIGLILTGPIDAWAMCCFSPQRRPLVDAALHAIDARALLPVLARLQEIGADSPAAIAASDALFWHIGLRLCDDIAVPPEFGCLARMVSLRMQGDTYASPALWSRSDDTEAARLAWLSICWAWSLWQPSCLAHGDCIWEWHFPGWDEGLATRPDLMLHRIALPDPLQPLSSAWRCLLRVGGRLARQLDTPPNEGSPFLHTLLLIEAAKGRWPVQDAWMAALAGQQGLEVFLTQELAQLGTSAARRLLPAVMDQACNIGSDMLKHLGFYRSPLRTWIFTMLTPDAVLASLNARQRQALWHRPVALPPALLAALLDDLDPETPARHPSPYALERAIDACDATQTDTLVRLIRRAMGSYDAARRLWEVAPAAAEALLRDAGSLPAEAARTLIHGTPVASNHAAAAAILAHPSLLGLDERRDWVRENLPHANGHAHQFIAMLSL